MGVLGGLQAWAAFALGRAAAAFKTVVEHICCHLALSIDRGVYRVLALQAQTPGLADEVNHKAGGSNQGSAVCAQ